VSQSKLAIGAVVVAVAATGAQSANAMRSTQVSQPEACWAAKAGTHSKSWCLSRTKVRVHRGPKARAPRVHGGHVRPGRITGPRVGIDAQDGRITVTYNRPGAESPTVEQPGVERGSVDAGEYEADSGMRDDSGSNDLSSR
jgi:hypothetical protein